MKQVRDYHIIDIGYDNRVPYRVAVEPTWEPRCMFYGCVLIITTFTLAIISALRN